MKLSLVIFLLLISFSNQWNFNKFIHGIESHIKHAITNKAHKIIPNQSTKPVHPKPVPPPPTPIQQKNQLLKSIQGQLGQLDPIKAEPSTSNLVKRIESIGVSHFVQCNVNELTSKLSSYDLPQKVLTEIDSIVYMQSETFQGFNFLVKSGEAELKQIAGAARNVQGTVQVAFVNAVTNGVVVQQYQEKDEHYKDCHYCFNIRNKFQCCTDKVQKIKVPLGLSAVQLEKIEEALQYSGKQYIQDQLDNPPATFKNYPKLEKSFLNFI